VVIPTVSTASFLPPDADPGEIAVYLSRLQSDGDTWLSITLDADHPVQLHLSLESAARLESALAEVMTSASA